VNRANPRQAQTFCPLTTLHQLKETLDKYGVAVLPDVFTSAECETVKTRMFEYLAREHQVTKPDDFKRLKPLRGGMMKSYGIALQKEILDLKTDERVVDSFRQIWAEKELTTALDSIYIGPPEFFAHFNESSTGADWFILRENHLDWYLSEKSCVWCSITAPKGSMVFWDSRTIHMGTLPRQDRVNKDRWRFIAYVCYTPARYQSERDAELKRQAYIDNKTTSHWPYGVNVGSKPIDDGKKMN